MKHDDKAMLRFATDTKLVGLSEGSSSDNSRIISYRFSDASVARDGHIILADAWDLANFLKNPVFLWAHDGAQPPIGRVLNLRTERGVLRGDVDYADYETYPFADTIFRLTKGGFLNATSVSWLPRAWKPSRDKNRDGVDFTDVELLEISKVPVPSLPTALVEARAQGIDTKPLFDWAERMLDTGGYKVISRTALENLRKEAAVPKITPPTKKPDPVERTAPKLVKRGLGHVSYLAGILNDLGYLQDSVEWEAAYEEDDSTVPADLLTALKSLGEVLVKMTIEEVTELLAEDNGERAVENGRIRGALAVMLARADTPILAGISHILGAQLRGAKVVITSQTGEMAVDVGALSEKPEFVRAIETLRAGFEQAVALLPPPKPSEPAQQVDPAAEAQRSADEALKQKRQRAAKAAAAKFKFQGTK